MRNFNRSFGAWFDDWTDSLMKAGFVLGGLMILLAVSIWVFPAILAFLFGSAFLFFGALALMAGFRIRQFKNDPASLGFQPVPVLDDFAWRKPIRQSNTIWVFK